MHKRLITDAATVLTVIAGQSPREPRTSEIPFSVIPDYAAPYGPTDLGGLRIGIPRKHFDKIGTDDSQAFAVAVAELEEAGAVIADNVRLLAAEAWNSYSSEERLSLIYNGFASTISEYFNTLG